MYKPHMTRYSSLVNDNERYEAFMASHADELRKKADNAAGTPCPVCHRDPSPLRITDMPWLQCEAGHTIRCWTQDEIEAMDSVHS